MGSAGQLSSNICVHPDFSMYVSVPDYNNCLGNLNDYNYIASVLCNDKMIKFHEGYLKSLQYSRDSLLTNGGGFFGDKMLAGYSIDEPNHGMIKFFKILMEE